MPHISEADQTEEGLAVVRFGNVALQNVEINVNLLRVTV